MKPALLIHEQNCMYARAPAELLSVFLFTGSQVVVISIASTYGAKINDRVSYILRYMLKCREQGSQHDQRIMLSSSDHASNLNRGVLVDNSYEHLFFSTITIIPYKSRRRIRTGIATHPANQSDSASLSIQHTSAINLSTLPNTPPFV